MTAQQQQVESTVLDLIKKGGIIAILRGDFRQSIDGIGHALLQGGILAAEVTLNSPHALDQISRLSQALGSTMAVGAGTVRTPEEVDLAADAGASYIVSPNCNLRVIARTKERGLVSIPGCFTPSEVMSALDAGADLIKLFPAVALGVGFLRALLGPLPDVKTVPTGGLTIPLVEDFIRAGSVAVGLGADLVPPGTQTPEDIETVHQKAVSIAAVIRNARGR